MVDTRDLKSLGHYARVSSSLILGTAANIRYASDTLITVKNLKLVKNPKITPEEIKVIKAAQNGSIPAFNCIFKRYKSFVSNILYGYIKDKDEADDITNIVFLKVYDKLQKFTAYDSFGGWLRIIANNTAVDYLRRTKHTPIVIDNVDVRLTSSRSISSDENDIVNRLTYEQILKEFNALSEQAQKVCELFYIDNMTSEKISEVLQIPIGTEKSHLSRSRNKLRKQFKTI